MRLDQHVPAREVEAKVFDSSPESVGEARSWAASLYAELGGDVDSCLLLVSELATNAVQHADSKTFEVRVSRELWVEVWDESRSRVRRRAVTEESESGRGLVLLAALAPGYKVVYGNSGKGIRFIPQGL